MLFRDGNQSHRCRSRHLLRPSLRSGPLVLAEVPIRLPGGCAREGESWPELGPRRLPLAPEHMEAAVVSPTFPQEGQRARCPSIPPWERDGPSCPVRWDLRGHGIHDLCPVGLGPGVAQSALSSLSLIPSLPSNGRGGNILISKQAGFASTFPLTPSSPTHELREGGDQGEWLVFSVVVLVGMAMAYQVPFRLLRMASEWVGEPFALSAPSLPQIHIPDWGRGRFQNQWGNLMA